MNTISSAFKTTTVRVALAVVAVIAVLSLAYFLIESTPPKVTYAAATTGNITQEVTATGTVTPVQNPTLTFETGGQVKSVNATVGEKVSAGALLASLDTGVLGANLEAAEAKLNQLETGPRGVDVAGQQTSVSSAQQTLANTYANYPQTLQSYYAQAQQAVSVGIDPLFDLSYRTDPALVFDTVNPSTRITADQDRFTLVNLFPTWQAEISGLSSSSTPAQLQTATTDSLNNLYQVRSFISDVITALNDAQVGSKFTQTQETAGLAEANQALTTVNGIITSLNTASQSFTTQQLAIQSAQDQLSQTLAGATSQDVQAQQAAVAAIEAQIRQQQVVAPFSGTVASVNVKQGDVVSATTPIISLIPNGNFEVDVYLAENDVTTLKLGDTVDVTLDAYGTGRVFSATVSAIDTSPSTQADGTQGYKVTLIFTTADPAIANGMHANVTIHAGSAQNVLLIPRSALITNGNQTYVLKQTANGPVKTPVTVGISNSTSVQVLSGLSSGDKVSAVGSQ